MNKITEILLRAREREETTNDILRATWSDAARKAALEARKNHYGRAVDIGNKADAASDEAWNLTSQFTEHGSHEFHREAATAHAAAHAHHQTAAEAHMKENSWNKSTEHSNAAASHKKQWAVENKRANKDK